MAQDAAAETTKAKPDSESRPDAEDIIVTARKRNETLINVPVVITALSQETLERAEIHDLYTLSAHVPSLSIGFQSGVLGPQISIRGVGTTAANATVDQSVSLNIDGLQLTQGFAYQSALFDAGQVEVLKGPQALFFGKNSPAGVISLRTADPTDTPEIIVRGGYEAIAHEKVGELIVSGPVSSSLKLRFAGQYVNGDGYFRNLDTAPEGYGVRSPTTRHFATNENIRLRGTALFNPSETYDARLKVNYTHDMIDNGGGDTQVASCPGGLTSFTGLPVFDPNEDCKLNRNTYVSWLDPAAYPYIGHGGVPFTRSHSWFGTLEQNGHFGDLTLTSLTGYYRYHQTATGNGGEVSGVTPLAPRNTFSQRELTQEIRLSSDFKGPVNFLLGGFYEDGRLTNHVRIYGNTAIGLPPILQDVIHRIDISSLSGFGQLRWDVNDKIELSAGARLTHEVRRHRQDNVATPGVPVGRTPLLDPRLNTTNLSPEVTLAYRPTGDLTLFTSYKEGFKSGSFNTVVYIDPTTEASFNEERVKGGEIGLKSRLFDRQLTLNVAGYYYHYTGLQVGASDVTPTGGIAFRTLNAASANVRGVELDFTYSPRSVEGLSLHGAANFNLARYDRFPNATCGNNQTISEGCDQFPEDSSGRRTAQDLSGRPLVRAPKWVINGGFTYDMPVGDDMRLGFGGDANFSSRFSQALVDLPGFYQSAYVKLNANISLKGKDDKWEVALIGNNITDKITAASCFNANLNGAVIFGGQVSGAPTGGPAGDDYKVCAPERGREVWLRFTLRPLSLFGR